MILRILCGKKGLKYESLSWNNRNYRKAGCHSFKIAEQISSDKYGIENMDAKYLAEDLIENEPELFQK